MIRAVFKKRYFLSIISHICGTLLIAFFAFVFVKDKSATFGDFLTGIIMGSVICIFSIISYFHNRKAYLYIDGNGYLKGKYHFFGKIHCPLTHVAYALGLNGTVVIHLKDGKSHTIMGIENPYPLAVAIRQNITFESTETANALKENLQHFKAGGRKYLIQLCIGIGLMFINILIAVLLTGGKDLNAFSKMDWILFSIMVAAEIGTVIATFCFAQKYGTHSHKAEPLKYALRRTLIETAPLLPGRTIGVYTDDNYSGRITLYGYPHCEEVYYSIEKFDGEYTLQQTYTSDIFESREELTESFAGLTELTSRFSPPDC